MSDYGASTRGSFSSGPRGLRYPRGRGSRGNRGRGLGRNQGTSQGSSSFRGGQPRGRGGFRRGRGRFRGRTAKPSIYQEWDCGSLSRLASEMNADNAFYNFCKRSVYTEEFLQEHRENIQSTLLNNHAASDQDTAVTLPDDIGTITDDLIAKGMTEKAFSNCWPLYGSFFENLKIHGWVISYNPEIPMQKKKERESQLFDGTRFGSKEYAQKKKSLQQ